MSKNQNNQEKQLLIKQLIRDCLNENRNELQNDDEEKDNSFVYLENKTLHMLITYILLKFNVDHDHGDNVVETDSFDLDEITAYIDSMIEENRKLFEEVIDILKES